MARVNIYLPDDLAEEARSAGLNISNVAQDALRRELANRATSAWVERVRSLPPLSPAVAHAAVLEAIDTAREEMGEHREP
jgi:post-segregation antitoxin (ccd killing protein)